jgi:hypothetical protein
VRQLQPAARPVAALVDLGCGTGAAGAAWATCQVDAAAVGPHVIGVDRNAWALTEAADTYRTFGIDARVRRGDASALIDLPPRSHPAAWLAAFTINELTDADREALLPRLLARAREGDAVLIVEPIGRVVGRWWTVWRSEFERAGGRADEWRFPIDRPSMVAKLDAAAGLDHREITGRSLWIAL